MMNRYLVAVAVALCLCAANVAPAAAEYACTWDSGNGATFDVSFLKLSGSYDVVDADYNVPLYTFIFNICANTAEVPETVRAPTACNTTTGADNVQTYGPAPAFQVSNYANSCQRLGASGSMQWSQFDPYDVTRGVTIKYTGGDACGGSAAGQKRSFAVHLMCADDGANIPDEEPVENLNQCSYEVFVQSTFGCPTSCFGSNFKMCSSHGVCGYDQDRREARCFCNPGHTGTYCDQVDVPVSGMTGAVATLIVVSILLVLVLGVLFYLWIKIKSLRLDPAAYATLSGGDDAPRDPAPAIDDAAL